MIDQLTERRDAAEFWLMRRSLMLMGVWLLAGEAVSVIQRLVLPHDPKITAVLVSLACVYFALGLWMLKAPSPSQFLAVGCLVLAGVPSFLCSPGSKVMWKESWPTAQICCVFIALVVCTFLYCRYQRFARFAGFEPPRAVVDDMAALIKRTMRGDSGDAGERARLWMYRNYAWKIGCFGDEMLMVADYGWDLCYAQRDDVRLLDRGKVIIGSDRKVLIEVGRRKWKGRIDAAQYERLANWASGSN